MSWWFVVCNNIFFGFYALTYDHGFMLLSSKCVKQQCYSANLYAKEYFTNLEIKWNEMEQHCNINHKNINLVWTDNMNTLLLSTIIMFLLTEKMFIYMRIILDIFCCFQERFSTISFDKPESQSSNCFLSIHQWQASCFCLTNIHYRCQ